MGLIKRDENREMGKHGQFETYINKDSFALSQLYYVMLLNIKMPSAVRRGTLTTINKRNITRIISG